MTLSKFPIPPDQARYSYKSPKDVVSIELDGGLSRTRRDIVGCPAIIDVQWTFDLSDYQYFRAFYNFRCGRGTTPFLMDLLLDQPHLEEYTCKFVGNTVEMGDPEGFKRTVIAQLEVVPIEDPILDETLVTLYEQDVSCRDRFAIFNLLNQVVNLKWPKDPMTPALAKLVNVDLEQSRVDPILIFIPGDDLFAPLDELVNEDLP